MAASPDADARGKLGLRFATVARPGAQERHSEREDREGAHEATMGPSRTVCQVCETDGFAAGKVACCPALMADDDFASMFQAVPAESRARRLRDGEVVEGTVSQIGGDSVFVDVGSTKDARIPSSQLTSREGELLRESRRPDSGNGGRREPGSGGARGVPRTRRRGCGGAPSCSGNRNADHRQSGQSGQGRPRSRREWRPSFLSCVADRSRLRQRARRVHRSDDGIQGAGGT